VAERPLHVAVTGAAGQIGYAIVFRIASGQLLGPDQPIVLHMLEIEPAMKSLEGVAMELDDCAFPLLHDIVLTSKAEEAFDGVSWALLVGSVPRKAGMERGDLLSINGGIFGPQGKAIAAKAAQEVRILVVGNPCNTNCLIAMRNARGVPPERFSAMTRLDQNRAKAQLALKARKHWSQVRNVTIWGNHSNTQFPDWHHATIDGVPAAKAVNDDAWLQGPFIKTVQERGKAVIKSIGDRPLHSTPSLKAAGEKAKAPPVAKPRKAASKAKGVAKPVDRQGTTPKPASNPTPPQARTVLTEAGPKVIGQQADQPKT